MKRRPQRTLRQRKQSPAGRPATSETALREVPKLPEKIEQALIGGNLVNLAPEERVSLYMATCKSLRLNPLTTPFCYILVRDWEEDSEKLILYAARNCTDQLRKLYGVTMVPGSLRQWQENAMLKAQVTVQDRSGRTDSDIGVIPLKRFSKKKQAYYELTGAMLANAEMHVVTKAKRRATLSLCGLGGIVDESELDTMNVIGGVTKEGRIWRYLEPREPAQLDENARHGHPVASERAKQAEETLRRVEQADEEFRAAEHKQDSGAAGSSQPESARTKTPLVTTPKTTASEQMGVASVGVTQAGTSPSPENSPSRGDSKERGQKALATPSQSSVISPQVQKKVLEGAKRMIEKALAPSAPILIIEWQQDNSLAALRGNDALAALVNLPEWHPKEVLGPVWTEKRWIAPATFIPTVAQLCEKYRITIQEIGGRVMSGQPSSSHTIRRGEHDETALPHQENAVELLHSPQGSSSDKERERPNRTPRGATDGATAESSGSPALPTNPSPQRAEASAESITPSRAHKLQGSAGVPTVLTGIVEKLAVGMTQQNNATRQLKIAKHWYTCYSETLFQFLDKAAGKDSEFYLDSRKTIVGIKRIGSRTFAEDGRTPEIQMTEPRGGNLFGEQ